MSGVTPLIVVHGGAGRVRAALHEAAVSGTHAAATRGIEALLAGKDAEAAAVAAVRVLEDDPAFNAGRGACMTEEGTFETDAGIMRSRDGAVGAVAAVPELADPVLVAQAVMRDGRHLLQCGAHAAAFARARGLGRWGADALWTSKAQDSFDAATAGRMDRDGRADTVGAVTRDARGDFCVAGSTGGVLLKRPGRVGDTPVVGAGFYASATLGACVATGRGEEILRAVFCVRLLERMQREGGDPTDVAQAACDDVRAATGAAVGVIGIAATGVPFVAHACPHMSWAWRGAAVEGMTQGGLAALHRADRGG